MTFRDDYFRRKMGKSREEYNRRTSTKDLLERSRKKLLTNFPDKLVYLGHSQKYGEEWLSQEDLDAHCHILGATRQGKSKLLELLIRSNIRLGYGSCLIDASENGNTSRDVLRYCASVNHRKVLLISPFDFTEFGRIPNLNPFKYFGDDASPLLRDILANRSVGKVFDTLRTIWGFEPETITRLQKYVPAVLHPLYWAGMTLAEAHLLVEQAGYHAEKRQLLAKLPPQHTDYAKDLQFAWTNVTTYKDFQSTVNQFKAFQDPILKAMVGSREKQINWTTLIADGWTVLVNLDTDNVWTNQIYQRMLGTLIINEIFYAFQRLTSPHRKNPWRGRFRLYIDECQDYATNKVKILLNKKSKLGLKLTLSHHYLGQIKDKDIVGAIKSNALMKFMFFMTDEKDRLDAMKNMGYGGALPDRHVVHELRQLGVAEATFTEGKKLPRKVKIADIDTPDVSDADLREFMESLYADDSLYQDLDTINLEINARFRGTNAQEGGHRQPYGPHPKSPRGRKVSDPATDGVPDPGRKPKPRKRLFS